MLDNFIKLDSPLDYICTKCFHGWSCMEIHPDTTSLLCPCPACGKMTVPMGGRKK